MPQNEQASSQALLSHAIARTVETLSVALALVGIRLADLGELGLMQGKSQMRGRGLSLPRYVMAEPSENCPLNAVGLYKAVKVDVSGEAMLAHDHTLDC